MVISISGHGLGGHLGRHRLVTAYRKTNCRSCRLNQCVLVDAGVEKALRPQATHCLSLEHQFILFNPRYRVGHRIFHTHFHATTSASTSVSSSTLRQSFHQRNSFAIDHQVAPRTQSASLVQYNPFHSSSRITTSQSELIVSHRANALT